MAQTGRGYVYSMAAGSEPSELRKPRSMSNTTVSPLALSPVLILERASYGARARAAAAANGERD